MERGFVAAQTTRAGVRGSLLEAMVGAVAAQGYAEVTLEDLAERTGLTVAEVGEHFSDEAECFMAAFDVVIERVRAQIAEHVAPGEWPDQMRAGVGAIVDLFTAEPGLARFALVEVAAVGPEAMIRYRQALELLHEPLERGRAYAERGDDLPSGVATMAIGAAITLLVEEAGDPRRDNERLEQEMLFALFLPYVGPDAARAELTPD